MSVAKNSVTKIIKTNIDWRLLSMCGEMITARLTDSLGIGIETLIRPRWSYDPNGAEGIAPIPNALRLRTFGKVLSLGTKITEEFQLRLVSTRDNFQQIVRSHLVLNCILTTNNVNSEVIATAEFWLALTRPFAAPSERKILKIPAALGFLIEQHEQTTDLRNLGEDFFSCSKTVSEEIISDTKEIAYHMDRSDSNRHVNMNVYIDQILDVFAYKFYQCQQDPARLRFKEIIVRYRKPFLPGDLARLCFEIKQNGTSFEGAAKLYHPVNKKKINKVFSIALKTTASIAPD